MAATSNTSATTGSMPRQKRCTAHHFPLTLRAQAVQTPHFDLNHVETASLLSIKTGAVTRNCGYCAHYDTSSEVGYRSGPIVIEIEYRAAQANARAFHNVCTTCSCFGNAMAHKAGRLRATSPILNSGGTLSLPTWLDCLRQRSRSTKVDRALGRQVAAFYVGSEPVCIHRTGAPIRIVAWKEDIAGLAANEVVSSDRRRSGRQSWPTGKG